MTVDRVMDEELRAYFDEQLDWVVERLSPALRRMLDEVPLYVEDYPSKKMRARMGVRRRDHLQGLYSGIALPDRSVDVPPMLSEVIYLFREGILALSQSHDGIDEDELREQIRITLLHELGHHFGLNEADLERLGYG